MRLFASLENPKEVDAIISKSSKISGESVQILIAPGILERAVTKPLMDKRSRYVRQLTLRAHAVLDSAKYPAQDAQTIALCAWSDQGSRLMRLRWRKGEGRHQRDGWFQESPGSWVPGTADLQIVGYPRLLSRQLNTILNKADSFSIDVAPALPTDLAYAVKDQRVIGAGDGMTAPENDWEWFRRTVRADYVFRGRPDALVDEKDVLEPDLRQALAKRCPKGLYSLVDQRLVALDWSIINAREDVAAFLVKDSSGFFCQKVDILAYSLQSEN
jgi:hypothetical protein